jgi:hypothetical protein
MVEFTLVVALLLLLLLLLILVEEVEKEEARLELLVGFNAALFVLSFSVTSLRISSALFFTNALELLFEAVKLLLLFVSDRRLDDEESGVARDPASEEGACDFSAPSDTVTLAPPPSVKAEVVRA